MSSNSCVRKELELKKKRAEVVTKEDEERLWSTQTIGNNCTFNITVARPDKQPTTTFPNDFFDGLRLEDLLN